MALLVAPYLLPLIMNLSRDLGQCQSRSICKEYPADSWGSSVREEMPVVGSGSVAARMNNQRCRTMGFVKPLVKRKLIHVGSSSRSTRQKSSPASMEAKAESSVYLTIYVDEGLPDMKGECETLRERNKVRDKECEEPKAKCEAAMADFNKNPAMMVFRQKTVSLVTEVKEHKGSLDRMLLESQKWVGYQENLATLKSKVTDFEAEKRGCKDEGALRSGESERF
uniref:Uncharacterized protein n=1 Tax=Tanacetum cinerariifolium TaxID=118510 RepID=A0A699GGI6_TANCI|nr:hypothetical protein [Tanacetum cinerariifolium]